MVGIERQIHDRWTGLRTHMAVAVEVAVFAVAGLSVVPPPSAEATRVIQGNVAAIGSLGPGTILKLSDQLEVKRFTTARSIWLAVALGTAAGSQMYGLAIAATIVALIVLAVLRPLENWFDEQTSKDWLVFSPGDAVREANARHGKAVISRRIR